MLKIIIIPTLIFAFSCFGYAPRVKFLLENPQNLDHERGYFKGDFTLLEKKESLLGFSGDEFEKKLSFQIQTIKSSENYRLRTSDENIFFLGEGFSSTWLKAIISSFVFNDGKYLMELLGMELGDDFDQEIVDFLTKYIQEYEETEKLQDESDIKVEQQEVSLTDVSKVELEPEGDAEKEVSLEDILSRRFYRTSEHLLFTTCEFGPCLKLEKNGIKISFSRENLNLRHIEIDKINNDKIEKLSISFDNFQKIGGRYNFPKNITFEGLNQKYLIKIDSYYLSKRIPNFKNKALPNLDLNQIFSI